MRRRKTSSLPKVIKDYAVPIIGGILAILFIINLFSGEENIENKRNENRLGVELSLSGDKIEAYIIFPGGKENKIKENKTILYKGERIKIKKGTLSFSLPSIGDFNLQKLGELEYKKDGSLFLYSSDLWVNTISSFNINTRYANLNILENSSISIKQNEVATTIYALKGSTKISSLSGKEIILKKGQKITIGAKDTSKNDIDLLLLRSEIDDYFKASDWFLINKGDFYLSSEEIITSSGATKSLSGSNIQINSKKLIYLENIGDESSVLTPTIDILGSFSKETIGLITINNQESNISMLNKKFELKGFKLKSSINDIVFKIYDDNKNLLGKEIYTIYYSGGGKEDNTNTSINENQDFIKDASNFVFISPETTGKYITSDNFITIRGKTPPNTASKVTVNGYQLKSYVGTTWRYHADVKTNNLKEGTNIYDIKYYDKSGKIIFKTYYTIIKKKPSTSIEKKKTIKYSNEANI